MTEELDGCVSPDHLISVQPHYELPPFKRFSFFMDLNGYVIDCVVEMMDGFRVESDCNGQFFRRKRVHTINVGRLLTSKKGR
jgi:hypothetical protein